MGFLVGNDFIPNLPNMHISNGALPILYKSYMKVLPTLDGKFLISCLFYLSIKNTKQLCISKLLYRHFF